MSNHAEPGALPNPLEIWWAFASPFAFLFAARILWEKTIWTWSRGPQMVGFALWHIHPGIAVVGTLCSLAVALWLLIAIPFAISRRRDIEPWGLVDDGVFGAHYHRAGSARYFLHVKRRK